MSKKKVEIKRDALEPQTIKVVKKHNLSIISFLIVIGIFGTLIYFLDDLFAIYENYTKTGVISMNIANNTVDNTNTSINTNTNTNTVVTPPVEEPTEKEITYLTLNTDKKVSFSDVTFDNIQYQNNQINVSIMSNNNSTLALSKLSYFINI